MKVWEMKYSILGWIIQTKLLEINGIVILEIWTFIQEGGVESYIHLKLFFRMRLTQKFFFC